MPKIIRDSAQDKALREIESQLSIVKEINEIVLAGYSGHMDVVVVPEEGRKCKAKVLPEYRHPIMVALSREKKALARQILSKARRFHIELSEFELSDLIDLEVPKDRTSEAISVGDVNEIFRETAEEALEEDSLLNQGTHSIEVEDLIQERILDN